MKRKSQKTRLFFVWAFAILACLDAGALRAHLLLLRRGRGRARDDRPARRERAARRRRRDRPPASAPTPDSAVTGRRRAGRRYGHATRRTPPPSCSVRPRTPARRTSTSSPSWATARPTASNSTRSSPAARTPPQVWTPASGTLTLYNYATATIVFPEDGRADKHSRRGDAQAAGVPGHHPRRQRRGSQMDEDWFKTGLHRRLSQSIQAGEPEHQDNLQLHLPRRERLRAHRLHQQHQHPAGQRVDKGRGRGHGLQVYRQRQRPQGRGRQPPRGLRQRRRHPPERRRLQRRARSTCAPTLISN